MASITLDHVSKTYPNGVLAVDDVHLEMPDGEFMVLVGPSGCGKSTLLRMIAGLEDVTDGGVFIGDRDVTYDAPRSRDVAMVFQSYALYPHMTVRKNLGLGLKLRHAGREEITTKVNAVASTLGLSELLDRKPSQLSGGQRQRVAMGRALVRDPAAFLMDEPLSNLDAKLRVSMREELARLHRQVGTTTVYVTHDQVEAMTLGTRVAVMSNGVLQQCDTPGALFHQPDNLFCAAFIGSPQINLVEADVVHQVATCAGVSVPVPGDAAGGGERVVIGIRPTDLHVADAGAATVIDAEVDLVENLGAQQHVVFQVDARPVDPSAIGQEEVADHRLFDEPRSRWTVVLDDRHVVRVGDRIPLTFAPERAHLFALSDGRRIR